MTYKSLNSGDVFILDTENFIYQVLKKLIVKFFESKKIESLSLTLLAVERSRGEQNREGEGAGLCQKAQGQSTSRQRKDCSNRYKSNARVG